MTKYRLFFAMAGAATLGLGSAASAQPTIDGSIAGDPYGDALAVQTVQTQFGDNLSELNAAYGIIDGGFLYLALTGNIEGNFNKLEIFIDSVSGGENTLSGMPGNDNTGNLAGLTFDSGFAPDYQLIARRGFADTNKFDLDFAELGSDSNFSSYQSLFGDAQEGSAMTGTGTNATPISVAYDNSNDAGIMGGTDAADQAAALAVTTGLELAIALSDLGDPTGPIKVSAFVNNGDHNFLSNQSLGGLPAGTGNLGGDGGGGFTGNASGIDFNQFPGDQFFIVPEPATLGLLSLGGLLVARRRRA